MDVLLLCGERIKALAMRVMRIKIISSSLNFYWNPYSRWRRQNKYKDRLREGAIKAAAPYHISKSDAFSRFLKAGTLSFV